MDKNIIIKTPIPPSVNDYLGKKVIFINGKPVVQMFETSAAKNFKTYVKNILIRECKLNGWTKTDNLQYVICEVVAYMPQKKRDADNIFKCLLDAFKDSDVVFYDDCMVIPRIENIFIDAKNPRLEIKMYPSAKVGVFKDSKEMDEFCLKNCFTCKKFKRYDYRCKQLKNCLENKIIDEVDFANTDLLGEEIMKDFEFFESRAPKFSLKVKAVAEDLTMVYGDKFRFDNWLIEDAGEYFNLWHLSKNNKYNKTIVTRKDSRKQQLNTCSYHFQRRFSKKNRRKILRYIKDHNEYVAFYKKRNKINLVDRVLGNM